MPTTDPQAPATKEDIALLMEMIGKYYVETSDKFESLKRELKEEIYEMRLYFDFSVEKLRNDYLDVNREETTMIKERLTKVEQKVGIR